MKVTTGAVHDAMNALVNIGSRQGVRIPQMASFKLKQLHDKLMKQAQEIDKIHRELIIKYGEERFLDPPANTKPSGQFAIVDPEKMKAYEEEWGKFREEEMDVNASPISIVLFGNGDHGLDMKELVLLGPFVDEPKE